MKRNETSLRDLRGPQVPARGTFAGQLAKNMRETFMDAGLEYGPYDTGLSWPTQFAPIGKGLSFAYTSHKWEKQGKFNDYKHVAEAPQTVYAAPVLLRQIPRSLSGDPFVLERPDFVLPLETAELSQLLYLEMEMFARPGRLAGNEGLRRITIPGAVLYGGYARRPDAPATSRSKGDYKPFLFAAKKGEGVILLVTGRELSVTRDGIVG